jgi:hypothetical protein
VGQYVSRRQAPPGTLKRVSHTATPAALNMVLFLATSAAQALRRAPATRPSSTWAAQHSTAASRVSHSASHSGRGGWGLAVRSEEGG